MMIALAAWQQAADFDQFEAERLDLGEHAVERGLVGERTGQDGPVAPRPGLEGGERGADRLAQVTADTDPVALRLRVAARFDGGPPCFAGYACELGRWQDERSIARTG